MFKRKEIFTVLVHVCMWLALVLSIILWPPHHENNLLHDGQMSSLGVLVGVIPSMAAFYLQAYWLMPQFLYKKKVGLYVLLIVAVWISVAVLSWLLQYALSNIITGETYEPFNFKRLLPAQFFLMAGAIIGTSRQNIRLEKARKDKETEHLKAELAFLRFQVNPHFMLNVLNSMALLARRKSDRLERVLMKLAELMHYMLYSADNTTIRLEEEIDYLKAYVDLQLLRFENDVSVKFDTPPQTTNKQIEPMLLIPLVENAFKHGIGLVDKPIIMIEIQLEKGDRITMTVKNKFSSLARGQNGKPPGIGLKNLQKRLELIHPNDFVLEVSEIILPENWFTVILNIPLL